MAAEEVQGKRLGERSGVSRAMSSLSGG